MSALNGHELAWAAGFFDAEGCFTCARSDPRTGRRRAEVSVSQAGASFPETLSRFASAVGGLGHALRRPARGYLYYWYSHRLETVRSVAALLWPWLGHVKREQFRCVMSGLASVEPFPADPAAIGVDVAHELAWAAGLFDGEGTFLASVTQRSRKISASIPQASPGGIPEVLVRFQNAVSLGRITGPRNMRDPWSQLPQYRWEATSLPEVRDLHELLWPWLGQVKSRQAENALARFLADGRRA